MLAARNIYKSGMSNIFKATWLGLIFLLISGKCVHFDFSMLKNVICCILFRVNLKNTAVFAINICCHVGKYGHVHCSPVHIYFVNNVIIIIFFFFYVVSYDRLCTCAEKQNVVDTMSTVCSIVE